MGSKSKSSSSNSTSNFDYSLGNADYSTGNGGKTTLQLVGNHSGNTITVTDQGAVQRAMQLARETVQTIGNGAEQVVNGAYQAIERNQKTAFDTIVGLTQKENNDFKEMILYLVGGAVLVAFTMRASK